MRPLSWLVIFMVAVLWSCGQSAEPRGSTVIGIEGGVVTGPDGVTITFPAGAVDAPVGVSIRKLSSQEVEELGAQGLCGAAYAVAPLSLNLHGLVTVSLPDATCENAAFFVRPQRHTRWSAFPSVVRSASRVAQTPFLGVFGVGALEFHPRGDTTVFVGSGFEPRVTDRLGREVNEAWIELRSADTTRIAPDRERGSTVQHTLRRGLAVLEVFVPAAGVREYVDVTVIANPAARLTVVRGAEQVGRVGALLPDSVIAEVLDSDGNPVEGVWVDFYMKGSEGPRFVGGGPTDSRGRTGVRWRMPYEAGRHALHIVVPGTHLAETVIATAKE